MPRYAAIAVLALGADYAEAWSANGLRLAARQRAAPAQMAIAVDEKSEPLKFVTLKNSKGDSAKLYHFGACATSYVKGGVESLAVRPDAKMDGSKPISGGIPFCFPQFGPGVIQQHGFARNVDWTLAESTDGDEPSVTFTLEPTDYTKAMWDYPFACKYTVTLKADRLATEFSVSNTGTAGSFDFAAALHTYWAVSDIDKVTISGAFDGATYLDKMQDPPARVKASGNDITISGEVDQVYAGVSGAVDVCDAASKRRITVGNGIGWEDTVLWSPYGNEGMGYKNFVCVESAKADSTVTLGPGEYWTASMDVVPSAL